MLKIQQLQSYSEVQKQNKKALISIFFNDSGKVNLVIFWHLSKAAAPIDSRMSGKFIPVISRQNRNDHTPIEATVLGSEMFPFKL